MKENSPNTDKMKKLLIRKLTAIEKILCNLRWGWQTFRKQSARARFDASRSHSPALVWTWPEKKCAGTTDCQDRSLRFEKHRTQMRECNHRWISHQKHCVIALCVRTLPPCQSTLTVWNITLNETEGEKHESRLSVWLKNKSTKI